MKKNNTKKTIFSNDLSEDSEEKNKQIDYTKEEQVFQNKQDYSIGDTDDHGGGIS